jgi:hypothetical protein
MIKIEFVSPPPKQTSLEELCYRANYFPKPLGLNNYQKWLIIVLQSERNNLNTLDINAAPNDIAKILGTYRNEQIKAERRSLDINLPHLPELRRKAVEWNAFIHYKDFGEIPEKPPVVLLGLHWMLDDKCVIYENNSHPPQVNSEVTDLDLQFNTKNLAFTLDFAYKKPWSLNWESYSYRYIWYNHIPKTLHFLENYLDIPLKEIMPLLRSENKRTWNEHKNSVYDD